MENEDEIIRKKLIDKLTAKFSRRVSFEGNVRSGTVVYTDGKKTQRFYSEMGGGKCMFYISIPSAANWEKHTPFRLQERNEIVQFVAEETLRQQTSTSGSYYIIGEFDIRFMLP